MLTSVFTFQSGVFPNYCSFLPGRKLLEEPNLERIIVRSNQLGLPGDYEQKKTHANAWALLKYVWVFTNLYR